MKKFLKFLGIALVIIGAILLILPMIVVSMADLADYNLYTVGSFCLIFIGLLSHIIINKHMAY